MAFTKFILPALALASTAFAQCDGDLTISSTTDAAAIAGCVTYDGTVTIDSSASGQISLNGVRSISGDLICKNATELTAITSDQLNSIGGVFDLEGLTILSTLQFNSLSAVNRIRWIGLPALQGLNFNQGVSRSNDIYISNTQLNSLTGIELTAVGSLNVNNNPYLTTINVNNLQNVTNALSFFANGRDLQITLPNLKGAANLTFRDVSDIQMPSLASVAGSMGFYQNSFTSFSAPNLTSTGASLAIVDSPELTNLSFPSLVTIGGGFVISNNPKLEDVDGFPLLKTVVGALEMDGSFNTIVLPSINDVRGGSNITTTSTNSSICQEFTQAHSRGIIKGVNNCETGTASTASGTGSASSQSSSGAANPAVFDPSAPLTGLSAIIAAMLFL